MNLMRMTKKQIHKICIGVFMVIWMVQYGYGMRRVTEGSKAQTSHEGSDQSSLTTRNKENKDPQHKGVDEEEEPCCVDSIPGYGSRFQNTPLVVQEKESEDPDQSSLTTKNKESQDHQYGNIDEEVYPLAESGSSSVPQDIVPIANGDNDSQHIVVGIELKDLPPEMCNVILSKLCSKHDMYNTRLACRQFNGLLRLRVLRHRFAKGITSSRLAWALGNIGRKWGSKGDVGLETEWQLGISKVCLQDGSKDEVSDGTLSLLKNFSNCSALTLSICGNITDEGIKGLSGSCPRLKSLKLSHCENTSADIIQYLPRNLTSFALIKCGDVEEEHLGFLPSSLASLSLTNTSGTKAHLKKIGEICPELVVLNLSDCKQLEGSCLDYLPTRLHQLNIMNCSDITCFAPIQKLTQLTTLNLSGCSLTNLVFLPNSITHLDLSRTAVIDDIIKDLASRCPLLRVLSLKACSGITNASLQSLPRGVVELDLSFTPVKDFSVLQEFKQLRKLNLHDCKYLKDKDLQFLPRGIVELDLSRTPIEDFSVLPAFECLEMLNLSHCEQLLSKGLQSLPKTIVSLNLDGCVSLDNIDALKDFDKLIILRLDGCIKISEESVSSLPKGLRRLSLIECENVTGQYLNNLRHTSLKKLSLADCINVTNEDLQYLPEGLVRLDLTSTNDDIEITQQGKEYLRRLKNLRALVLPNEEKLKGAKLREYLATDVVDE